MRTIKPILRSLLFKLFLSVFLIIGPLIVVLIVNTYYSVTVLISQVSQSNKNMLNIYLDQIDRNLEGVGNYIFQISQNNPDISLLQYNENIDPNYYELAKIRLFDSISSQSNFYNTIDSIFIYSTTHKDFMNTPNYADTYPERKEAREEIHHLIDNKKNQLSEGKWTIWKGKDHYYMLYILKNEDVYVGAWVNMDKLVKPFKYVDFGETGRALLATSDLSPISNKKFMEDENIDLNSANKHNSISGKTDNFLLIKEKSSQADFYLVALIPDSEVLKKLPFIQRISYLITIVAVLFLCLFIFIMRRVFLQPINRIVTAMKKLRQGNLDTRLPIEQNSTEFKVMNEQFNRMISEIKDLKINVYEEKLKLQRAELKHLQLQINPHFFLNSLNIIYNLANVKDFAVIQEMSKCLINYFRFMFRSNSYFVNLKDEIKHTANYLRIQQLRFPDTFHYSVETQADLEKCKIPPLIIQTIAENSIKHAISLDEPLNIHIVINEDEDSDFINIKIQDTGEGFPEDVLYALEFEDSLIASEGERIGIWNVKQRLKLLYKGNSAIHFSNEEGIGATVHVRIPKILM
jgi:two-component system, sensor histidine kinase YesM